MKWFSKNKTDQRWADTVQSIEERWLYALDEARASALREEGLAQLHLIDLSHTAANEVYDQEQSGEYAD